MARPRVFISSTFFDLKHVRADIERFIREMGYDPVLNERGTVAYGPDKKLEEYAYSEVKQSNIIVSIIGGRFGAQSSYGEYSISNVELKTALEKGIQVFIFIERGVYFEYKTYLANKADRTINYSHADNPAIYQFIEELYALPFNNVITPFDSAHEIIDFLREQWAGLFHRFLQEQSRAKEYQVVENLSAAADTLNRLVTNLTSSERADSEITKNALLLNHPIFRQLKELFANPYRVFFTNERELTEWLSAKSIVPVPPEQWDSPDFREWITSRPKDQKLLKISKQVFDTDGKLVPMTDNEWRKDYVSIVPYEGSDEPQQPDNLPF